MKKLKTRLTILAAGIALSAAALAQTGPVAVDIAPQPLHQALNALARQTGAQILFVSDITTGKSAPAVKGSMTVREALAQLLQGSSLKVRAIDERSFSVVRDGDASGENVLPQVDVTAPATANDLPPAYAGGQVARGGRVGLLGNQDFMDTPLSIASYTAQTIEDQQPRTVGEFLARNDPSVRIGGGDTSSTESTQIRGFSLTSGSDYVLNGLPGLVAQYRSSTEFVERAEVLKGPSAMLSGMMPSGSTGGAINLQTKHAHDEPLTRLTTSYLADSRLGLHADIGRRFGADKEWGIRFNGAWRKGDTARNGQDEHRWLASLGLDYRSDRLRVSLDAIDQHTRQHGARGGLNNIAAAGALPAAPNGKHNLDQPWAVLRNSDKTIMARAEYDFSHDLTAWFSIGRAKGIYSGKDAIGGNVSLLNADGDTRLDRVGRAEFFLETVAADAGLRGQFQTGRIGHNWSLNASSLKRDTGWGFGSAVGGMVSNIYHPIHYPVPTVSPAPAPGKTSDVELPSIALADTLSFADDRVLLTLGVRRQSVKTRNYNSTTGAQTSSYDESATTPFAGVVVKPWKDVSLYANYVEGLSQGQAAPDTASNAGEVFPPYKAKQYEVGVKYDLGNFATTVSLFQINRPSAALGADNIFAINGEQRNRGLEISAFGEVTRGTRLLGGVTLLNAELTETPTGANEGNRAIGTSKVSANLGAEWDFPSLPGLTLTAGAVHTSSSFVDIANKIRAPGWTRTDLGLRYHTRLGGKTAVFRATLENAFDKAYWAINTSGNADLGTPRTFLLSATVDF
ncbi:ferric-mycobactin receptor FemA [Oxalicibacterium flavum]|uniref:Ferric-mycobactin receptor FemA n=1 Tax=Oxalicibacterium flavum TaxID=179467 RepID=A0A8J2UNY2_9BURK|nr:TonB-dependent receptor [Oxalicibacterium flavum]GGC09240.1 ferric-mycobactin receptor FemA [Oxalicibacterium flavum]